MRIERLSYFRRLLIKAAVYNSEVEVPEWRFDGKAITTAEEVAAALNIPVVEAHEHLEQKDVYGGSGSGTTGRGVGTRTLHDGLYQRANALAYGKRRRRRHKRRSEK